MLDKILTISCQDLIFKSKGVLLILQRLGVGLRETFHLGHLRHISPIDEDVSYGSIVDILGVCTLRKESSVMPSLVTQYVLLFANHAVPDLLMARVDDEATSP